MDIHSDSYKLAELENSGEAVELIRSAEVRLAELAGRPVTLIAYEQTGAVQA